MMSSKTKRVIPGVAIKRISIITLIAIVIIIASGCQNTASHHRPIIGITSFFNESPKTISVDYKYIQAVLDNGGVPVILPAINDPHTISKYVTQFDGLVLIGGPDIPPAAYGQKPHETVKPLTQLRYDFESQLIAEWLQTKKPILGICLGMQFTNVVRGGSLIQDIPSQVDNPVAHRGKNSWHKVKIENNSLLGKILSANEPNVYSNHHQAVKDLGKNLKVIACSSDGVIEALQRTDGPFGLFVQWHPEAMTENPDHRNAIYGALVKACMGKLKGAEK
jgi:putative glutamine amidotransferase